MKNQLKMGVYLSYVSIFLTNITNLVLTPFIVRNLGQSQYGLYMLIGALIGYIAVLDFGLGNTTVRYVSKYRAEKRKDDEENFLFLTFFLYLIMSVIILIVGFFVYVNLGNIFGDSLTLKEIELAKVMFFVLVINIAITLPMKSIIGIINAYEQFAIPRLLTIGRILVRVLLVGVFLSFGYKALAIVLIDAVLNVLMMLASMIYVFYKLKVKIILHNFNLQIVKEIFSFSSLIFISVIVDQLYWRIGHLILGIVASSSEVAVFAIGMTFGQYFITFSTAISGVFLPRITKMVSNKASNEDLTEILIKTGRIQFIVLALILTGFLLFGRKFIVLWVGEEFSLAWIIAILIMIPLVVVLTQTIGISILQAKNKHGFRAIALLIISIINVLLSVFMANTYGALGAALGTTISLILGNVIVMNLYYYYKIGLNMPRFYKEVFKGLFPASIISSLLGLVIFMLSNYSWFTLAIQCLLYMGVYTITIWLVGLNKYEKNLFKKEFVKIKDIFTKPFVSK